MWRVVKDRDLLIFHHLRHYKSQIRMHLLTQTHEVNTENDGKCAMRTRFVSLFARSFDVSTGIEHVGQLLVRLKELDLSYNLMSAEGASALVPFLSGEDVKLEVLNLRGNQLGDEGALLLAAALHSNKSIRTLDLSNNDIEAAGNVRGLGQNRRGSPRPFAPILM
eukprot:Tamp_07257.p2 GENE.Tamp_07257~~Tamp_07257.p2  ORF type:complete len:165 (-),score=25.92 Tamp_07257:952-1446(-)